MGTRLPLHQKPMDGATCVQKALKYRHGLRSVFVNNCTNVRQTLWCHGDDGSTSVRYVYYTLVLIT